MAGLPGTLISFAHLHARAGHDADLFDKPLGGHVGGARELLPRDHVLHADALPVHRGAPKVGKLKNRVIGCLKGMDAWRLP